MAYEPEQPLSPPERDGPEPEAVIAERKSQILFQWQHDAAKWTEVAADILTDYGSSNLALHKVAQEAFIALHDDSLGAAHFRKMVAARMEDMAYSDAESEYHAGELKHLEETEPDDGRGGAL